MNYINNGLQFHVLNQGQGPLTLIFTHYYGGSALEWQYVVSQLSAHYQCLSLDMRGCGDSEASPTGYSVDDMADDMAGLVQQFNLTNYVLVGHSMSGKAVLAQASRQPAGLRAMVLVSPSPPTPEPMADSERQRMYDTHGQREAAEQTLHKITVLPLDPVAQQQIVADNLRTSRPAWDAWLTLGSREDISDRMPAIAVPALVLVGEKDPVLPLALHQRELMPRLKQATLQTISGAGHLVPWENPIPLAEAIESFLNNLMTQ